MALLKAKGIAKAYPTANGSFYALRKTTLSFPTVGMVAIKGKSGSGKSTLLNLLAGIETPTSGQVFFNGLPICKRKRPLLGQEGAMVFQHYNLILGESALYNVALPSLMRGGSYGKGKELMRKLGLAKLMRKKVDVLSGGEKQRVAICRALITNPKVVFADEPTGALDVANSKTVMDTLKRIAKHRLVLFVSHNEELIESYADRVVEIVDGRVVADSKPLCDRTKKTPRNRFRHSFAWVFRFLFRNIRKHAFKDLTCLLSGFIGFASLLLSIGYLEGNMPAMEERMGKSLTYLNASVSARTTMEIPGSTLTLVKKSCPEEEEVRAVLPSLDGYDLVTDYGFFFPQSMVFTHEDITYEPTSFSPLFDITLREYGLDMVAMGTPPKGDGLDEAVVNAEFMAKYPLIHVGDTIAVHSRGVVNVHGKQNEVFVDAKLVVKAVVKEFGFLNSPRVYYSYPALRQELENIDLFSEDGDRYSVTEWTSSSPKDSVYRNYGDLLFLHEPSTVKRLFEAMPSVSEEGKMEIVSNVYALRESFSSLSMAFSSSLGLFIGIALAGLILILGMASFSSLVQGKKENAILMSLGARRGDILAIYCLEGMTLCGLSAALSFIFAPLLQGFANFLLEKEFDIPSLIRVPFGTFLSLPYGLLLLVFAGALILGFLSCFVPLKIFGRFSLAEELRDE